MFCALNHVLNIYIFNLLNKKYTYNFHPCDDRPLADRAPWGHSSRRTTLSTSPLHCSESLNLGQATAIVHKNLSMGSCKENKEVMLKTQWESRAYTLFREWAFCQANIRVKSAVWAFVWNIKCQFPKNPHIISNTQAQHVSSVFANSEVVGCVSRSLSGISTTSL